MSKKRGESGSTAVMARRAPTVVETDTTEQALWRTLDLFPTPLWAGRAGAELLRAVFPQARTVREPAAGLGHMVAPLAEYFPEVLASDVHDHGKGFEVRDWLDDGAWDEETPDCDLVVTNPPYSIADQFVTRGLRRARLGVALLVRLAFLEGQERHALMAGPKASLTLLAPFSERVSMTLGQWDPSSSLATSYAWMIWAKDLQPMPPRWLAPGTKERLTMRDDAMRFGVRRDLPLFPDAA